MKYDFNGYLWTYLQLVFFKCVQFIVVWFNTNSGHWIVSITSILIHEIYYFTHSIKTNCLQLYFAKIILKWKSLHNRLKLGNKNSIKRDWNMWLMIKLCVLMRHHKKPPEKRNVFNSCLYMSTRLDLYKLVVASWLMAGNNIKMGKNGGFNFPEIWCQWSVPDIRHRENVFAKWMTPAGL